MTVSRLLNRRWTACWYLATAWMGLGCSSEPTPPEPKTPWLAPTSQLANEAAVPLPEGPSPWSADTLWDGPFTAEEGFRTLTFDDFEPFFAKPPAKGQTPWISAYDAIVCFGKPKGYLYSKEKFGDFTLRLELRFAPPVESTTEIFNPNTGVMIYITEPHKQWPKSLEVQGKFAELGTIKENGGAAKVEIVDDGAARAKARKPAGKWNALEIVSKEGTLTALLNGTKVCESQPSDVSEGAIGLQSEDFEVHFRRLRIRAE